MPQARQTALWTDGVRRRGMKRVGIGSAPPFGRPGFGSGADGLRWLRPPTPRADSAGPGRAQSPVSGIAVCR